MGMGALAIGIHPYIDPSGLPARTIMFSVVCTHPHKTTVPTFLPRCEFAVYTYFLNIYIIVITEPSWDSLNPDKVMGRVHESVTAWGL